MAPSESAFGGASPVEAGPNRGTLSRRCAGKSGRHGASMRPLFHRPSAARQPVAAGERADSERLVAEALLGVGHPLVRLLARFETVYEQLVWVAVVQAV